MTTRQQIAAAVSRLTGIDWWRIIAPGRKADVVTARDVTVAVARLLTRMSYPEIAEWLGYRSHTSAHAADKRAEKKLVNAVLVELRKLPTVIHLPVIEVRRHVPEHHRQWVDGVMERLRERFGLQPLLAANERTARYGNRRLVRRIRPRRRRL